MKDILISILWFAVISFAITTNYHISFRPLKFSIEHFNWGLTLGLFLVLLGFFIACGYSRHLGKHDTGYYKGYEDGGNDAIELVQEKYGKKP